MTSIDGSGTRLEHVALMLGGGLEFCFKDQEPTSCEDIEKNKSPYPTSNGNRGGTIGKFGVGRTYWKDLTPIVLA